MSFVRYERALFDRKTGPPAESSYLALVERSERPYPTVVPLGDSASIERLIDAWRRVIESRVRADEGRAAGARLKARVWDAFASHLNGVQRVFIVPDGALNLVSFAALPTSTSRYLIEDGPVVHYLSAERDLLADGVTRTRNAGLLAVGGAAFSDGSVFNGPGRRSSGSAPAQATRAAGDCLGYRDLQFGPLPATQQEAFDVVSIWRSADATPSRAGPTLTLTGAGATERAFKAAASGKRVVHLATHGFFLSGDCAPVGAAGFGPVAPSAPASDARHRGVGGLAPLSGTRAAMTLPPLLRAGLALAGSNDRSAAAVSDDDGILTAEEVAGLDLTGVEWAVLSACDTGVGTIAAGEGVFGLRRAFQIAGARTVVTSLWAVEDQASLSLMRALYRARLDDHLDTANAMRKAALSVLLDRRARGVSTNPFYWAGFVAAGDWR